MDAFLLSFGVIFVAELGDKSQLMALTFATRYRALHDPRRRSRSPRPSSTLVSVLVGAAVGAALPTDAISVVAGLAFLGFAAWTLRGDELDDDEAGTGRAGRPARPSSRSAWRSSSPSWATRRCWPPSRWPPTTGWSARGSARRSAWWPPTPWPSSSASSSAPACPSGPSRSAPPGSFVVFGVLLIVEGLT